ncbi:nuclear transport factor 2 family protein [Microbispora catharanthi]|uniref:Nuclear transport factor 2 family protein n=1 Tax=Microbispora catharanthi TaxID=1712871 RepID=A0A5N6BYW1_9ACTN|nr:nuclear transport factor 2 family protein [Microbispora catharanthi]KAB8185470.1 nuclear transport factor 2 family protein [Microbispora catharanthi]
MDRPSPRDVLARRRALILDGDLDGFADLFAPDGVIELPFAPPGMPVRVEGREAIRDFSSGQATAALRIEDMWTTSVYETTDPEVLVVELETRALVTATGAPYQARSVQVFRIRDGQILLLRDYWNPMGLADALRA